MFTLRRRSYRFVASYASKPRRTNMAPGPASGQAVHFASFTLPRFGCRDGVVAVSGGKIAVLELLPPVWAFGAKSGSGRRGGRGLGNGSSSSLVALARAPASPNFTNLRMKSTEAEGIDAAVSPAGSVAGSLDGSLAKASFVESLAGSAAGVAWEALFGPFPSSTSQAGGSVSAADNENQESVVETGALPATSPSSHELPQDAALLVLSEEGLLTAMEPTLGEASQVAHPLPAELLTSPDGGSSNRKQGGSGSSMGLPALATGRAATVDGALPLNASTGPTTCLAWCSHELACVGRADGSLEAVEHLHAPQVVYNAGAGGTLPVASRSQPVRRFMLSNSPEASAPGIQSLVALPNVHHDSGINGYNNIMRSSPAYVVSGNSDGGLSLWALRPTPDLSLLQGHDALQPLGFPATATASSSPATVASGPLWTAAAHSGGVCALAAGVRYDIGLSSNHGESGSPSASGAGAGAKKQHASGANISGGVPIVCSGMGCVVKVWRFGLAAGGSGSSSHALMLERHIVTASPLSALRITWAAPPPPSPQSFSRKGSSSPPHQHTREENDEDPPKVPFMSFGSALPYLKKQDAHTDSTGPLAKSVLLIGFMDGAIEAHGGALDAPDATTKETDTPQRTTANFKSPTRTSAGASTTMNGGKPPEQQPIATLTLIKHHANKVTALDSINLPAWGMDDQASGRKGSFQGDSAGCRPACALLISASLDRSLAVFQVNLPTSNPKSTTRDTSGHHEPASPGSVNSSHFGLPSGAGSMTGPSFLGGGGSGGENASAGQASPLPLLTLLRRVSLSAVPLSTSFLRAGPTLSAVVLLLPSPPTHAAAFNGSQNATLVQVTLNDDPAVAAVLPQGCAAPVPGHAQALEAAAERARANAYGNDSDGAPGAEEGQWGLRAAALSPSAVSISLPGAAPLQDQEFGDEDSNSIDGDLDSVQSSNAGRGSTGFSSSGHGSSSLLTLDIPNDNNSVGGSGSGIHPERKARRVDRPPPILVDGSPNAAAGGAAVLNLVAPDTAPLQRQSPTPSSPPRSAGGENALLLQSRPVSPLQMSPPGSPSTGHRLSVPQPGSPSANGDRATSASPNLDPANPNPRVGHHRSRTKSPASPGQLLSSRPGRSGAALGMASAARARATEEGDEDNKDSNLAIGKIVLKWYVDAQLSGGPGAERARAVAVGAALGFAPRDDSTSGAEFQDGEQREATASLLYAAHAWGASRDHLKPPPSATGIAPSGNGGGTTGAAASGTEKQPPGTAMQLRGRALGRTLCDWWRRRAAYFHHGTRVVPSQDEVAHVVAALGVPHPDFLVDVPLFATAAGLLVLALGDESLDEATRRVDAALAAAGAVGPNRQSEHKTAEDTAKPAENEATHVAKRMVPDAMKARSSSTAGAAVVALPRASYDVLDQEEDDDDGAGMSVGDASSLGDHSMPSITSHRPDHDRARGEKQRAAVLPKSNNNLTPLQMKGTRDQRFPQVS